LIPTDWNYKHDRIDNINEIWDSDINPIQQIMLKIWTDPNTSEIHIHIIDTLDPTAKTQEEYQELAKRHLPTIVEQAEYTPPRKVYTKGVTSTRYVNETLKHIWQDTLGNTPWRGGAYNRFIAVKIIEKPIEKNQ
jgi:hypothetical protein